ncbi:hypothetical protein [Hydrogenophaga sp. PAMC20947]|uniref:hypothetical protein n=1 Tax=Hydrogenophaga sp. PAMC20947 TaxID=2565558 RepID=UPI001FF723E8|nr:hypothetical protein [Hydrogenophaga sp. PAMC20947]
MSPCSWMAAALAAAAGLMLATAVQAQEKIYRCGNEYINNANEAKNRGCKPMEGGNITIIQGTAPQRASAPSASKASSAPRASGSRIDTSEQRSRDSDARVILESELNKAEDRLVQAKKAYANGEPEKEGIESRNYQRYLDRVAELKAAVARAESDAISIRRELDRLGPAKEASSAAK